MSIKHRPVGTNSDPIARIERDIAELQNKVAALKASSRPTIPVYTPGTIANLSTGFNDGEYWINTNNGSMYYFYDGATLRVGTV